MTTAVARRNKVTDPRWLAFVDAYCKNPDSGAAAAVTAGYPAKHAKQRAYRLLRIPAIQDLLGARNIDRGIHAEETYRNTIATTNAALGEMVRVLKIVEKEDATMEDRERLARMKSRALDTAGRALERAGKIEGLYVERVAFQDNRELTLQKLIEEFTKAARMGIPSRPVIDVPKIGIIAAPEIVTTPLDQLPTNGHKLVDGNGHKPEGGQNGDGVPGESPAA